MLLTIEKGTVVTQEEAVKIERREVIMFQGVVYRVPENKTKGEFMKELRDSQ